MEKEKEIWWKQPIRGAYTPPEQNTRLLQAILACLMIMTGLNLYAAYVIWDFRNQTEQIEQNIKRILK